MIVLAAVVLFMALALYQIDLPGFYYDEALDVVPAMQIMLAGQPTELLRGIGLRVPGLPLVKPRGLTLPVMTMDYLGAVNTYLVLPFFQVYGFTVFAVRFMCVVVAAGALVLAYFWLRGLFGPGVAGVAVLLLAVNPSFIFWGRMGVSVTSVMSLLAMAALLAFARWRAAGRDLWLFLGAVVLGLGLWAKFLFLWYIVALAMAQAILNFRFRLNRQALLASQVFGLTISQWLTIAVGLTLGAWPLLWFNLKTGGTVQVLAQNIENTAYGVNNRDFFNNLRTALESFRVFLNGGYFWYYGQAFENALYPAMFILSALGAAALVWARYRHLGRRVAFVIIVLGLLVLQSSFTISGLWATHLYIAVPLPQTVVALFAVLAGRWLAPAQEQGLAPPDVPSARGGNSGTSGRQARPWGTLARRALTWALPVVFVAPLFLGDLWVDLRYHQALQETGGLGRFSDAIYGLASYLDRNPKLTPWALDWGISKSVQVITQGRVNPQELYGFQETPGPDFQRRLSEVLADPDNIYLFHGAGSVVYPRSEAFLQAVRAIGKQVKTEQAFFSRSGELIYVAMSVQ
ncbi:MAG: glycosyltransferase family 39 protein [Chloroflexi bacterium]|nr:glycosyltransferase family 39 protein [Chloroflexota bacterium]